MPLGGAATAPTQRASRNGLIAFTVATAQAQAEATEAGGRAILLIEPGG
jgi:hypothetical protein